VHQRADDSDRGARDAAAPPMVRVATVGAECEAEGPGQVTGDGDQWE
jgi:hypothetical protein